MMMNSPTYPPYPTYKPSGLDWLGAIPAHWQAIKAKYLFEERIEKGFPNEPLLAATQNKGVVTKDSYENRTVTAQKDFHLLKLVEKGDFVISLRSFQGGIEIAYDRGIISPAYDILKPSRQIERGFFKHLFKSTPFISKLSTFVTGIREGQNIDYSKFKDSFLPVPPLDEQVAIADFLDRKTAQIDTFLALKAKTIALLKERKTTLINAAVTHGLNPAAPKKPSGIEWLGDIPAHWGVKKLKYVATVISKGTTPSTEGREMTDTGIRFIKAENIVTSQVVLIPEFFIDDVTHNILRRSQLQENDLLFVIAGATLGKVAILPKELLPANTNQAISFIRLRKDACHKFVFYWLQSGFITQQIWLNSVQSAQPNLSMQELSNFLVPYPPLEEQRQIVAYIEQQTARINTAIAQAEREAALMQEYRQALISAAVTGKIKIMKNKE